MTRKKGGSLAHLRTGRNTAGRHPSPSRYRQMIAQQARNLGIDERSVLYGSHFKRDVRARWAVWRELYEKGFSLPGIAKVAGKHHTTILYGIRLSIAESRPILWTNDPYLAALRAAE